ncbi:hypothetical protein SELMODRAFT_180070 [Selaginella moellendorffii]|uniref:AWPM-19-like family protein n=1 Tax=Selaginella moellendorffii TaxID=88036 RepID=D8SIW8_SELML|nr:membrane protein PM19L [Selaginella moellendorffii]EFJ15697.1 hypothetical protein SELMODRAFT_180070 [Selaginella moellendorffii]|eukprot:XP_002983355.1 membrane protein PM19L [Selaginella moellendorffii]
MAFGPGRSVAAFLLFLNFCMYMVVLGLAGWAMNKAIDYSQANIVNQTGAVTTLTRFPVGNAATPFFLLFILGAGVLGLASILAGAIHVSLWRSESLAAAISSALIAWLFTLLAFGFACKEIQLRGGYRNRRLKALEAFSIILAGMQLLYILSLHSGMLARMGPRIKEPGYGGMAQGVEQKGGPTTGSTI